MVLLLRRHAVAVPRSRDPFAGLVPPRARAELLGTGVTVAQLRTRKWQCTSRGFYLPADVSLSDPFQRILNASVRTPPAGAIGGWAAARVHGAEPFDGLASDGSTELDIPVTCGEDEIRAVPGIEVWADPLPAEEVIHVGGVRITGRARTCFDGMRRAANLVEAVVFADLMLHAELVTLSDMRRYVDRHPRWRGVPQARRALDLADPSARNAWETRLRMVWLLDAGLPRPLCNPPVFDLRGNLLGFPDLLDPESATISEFDGAGHRRLRQHAGDNVREELFEDHNFEVTRAVSLDFADTPELARRMRRARVRGLHRDRRRDRWTLEPPPDWGATGAQDEVNALLEAMDAAWVPPF